MRIQISGNLLRFSQFQRELTVQASTVESGLEALIQLCPDLKDVLFDGEHQVRGVHRLFLDGEQLDGLDVPVGEHSELCIVTAISGG